MKPKVQQMLSASVLSLLLSLGVTACTGAAAQEGGDAQRAPALALSAAVDSIKEYTRSDMNPPEGQTSTPAQDKVNSYFDPSIDAAKRSDVVMIFADILSVDPNATVEVTPNSIAVDGTTAVIESHDLKITIRGQEHHMEGNGGTLTLKAHDGKWLISDVSFPEEPDTATDPAEGEAGDPSAKG